MNKKVLTIIPSVPVWLDGEKFVFDRKFYDGMLMYVKEWPGAIRCVMSISKSPLPAFGVIHKTTQELPFHVRTLEPLELLRLEHIQGSAVVLATADDFRQLHIAKLCKKNSIKCVYTIEYNPETRHQIVNLEATNPVVKLRRHFYLWNGERKRRAAFRFADGLQANGTAAYQAYRWHKNCLLYFDTRVNRDIVIGDSELNRKLENLANRGPLQLAFSGRLISMKGADHLVELADILRNRGVEFHLTIYGSGELGEKMKQEISTLRLAENVSMPGAVEFYSELIPAIKAHIDVYVILHRQSDPSCTYMETLSCGIPIVGYENKAFSGILQIADIGWGKPIDDLNGIADIIENIGKHRELIRDKSMASARLSREHDFESTFKNRVKQLRTLVTS